MEYAILIALVSVVITVSVTLLGGVVRDNFFGAARALNPQQVVAFAGLPGAGACTTNPHLHAGGSCNLAAVADVTYQIAPGGCTNESHSGCSHVTVGGSVIQVDGDWDDASATLLIDWTFPGDASTSPASGSFTVTVHH